MQTHIVSKVMHPNIAIIVQQLNYGKNCFIVLVPGLAHLKREIAVNGLSIKNHLSGKAVSNRLCCEGG